MTVQEVLKQTGMTDEQIAALDSKVVAGFTTVLSTATQAETAAAAAKEAAELAQRAQQELYRDQIAPALDNWATEKANKDAEIAFYRTQMESARSAGFIPRDAPGYTAPATQNPGVNVPQQDPATGRFVPGANSVPGSPAYMTPQQTYAAVTNATWLINEHMRLHGAPLPDEIDTVLKEANDRRLDFRTYAAQKYKFDDKRAEIAANAQKAHDDKIRAEVAAAKDKEWAEKVGNNPNVRTPVVSSYADVAKAVASGQRKDPLTLTEAQRREQTRDYITTAIAQQTAGVTG